MAGSERSGAEFADPHLFSGCAYILTASSETPRAAINGIEALVGLLGARAIWLDADAHDRMVAAVSHLPQLLATALAAMIGRRPEREELVNLAGGGYSDMTRLAASQWTVWRDISETNADNLARELENLTQALTEMRDALEHDTTKDLENLFDIANANAMKTRQKRVKQFSN